MIGGSKPRPFFSTWQICRDLQAGSMNPGLVLRFSPTGLNVAVSRQVGVVQPDTSLPFWSSAFQTFWSFAPPASHTLPLLPQVHDRGQKTWQPHQGLVTTQHLLGWQVLTDIPDVEKAVDAMDLLLDPDLDTALDWIVGGKEPQTPRPSKAVLPYHCLPPLFECVGRALFENQHVGSAMWVHRGGGCNVLAPKTRMCWFVCALSCRVPPKLPWPQSGIISGAQWRCQGAAGTVTST